MPDASARQYAAGGGAVLTAQAHTHRVNHLHPPFRAASVPPVPHSETCISVARQCVRRSASVRASRLVGGAMQQAHPAHSLCAQHLPGKGTARRPLHASAHLCGTHSGAKLPCAPAVARWCACRLHARGGRRWQSATYMCRVMPPNCERSLRARTSVGQPWHAS